MNQFHCNDDQISAPVKKIVLGLLLCGRAFPLYQILNFPWWSCSLCPNTKLFPCSNPICCPEVNVYWWFKIIKRDFYWILFDWGWLHWRWLRYHLPFISLVAVLPLTCSKTSSIQYVVNTAAHLAPACTCVTRRGAAICTTQGTNRRSGPWPHISWLLRSDRHNCSTFTGCTIRWTGPVASMSPPLYFPITVNTDVFLTQLPFGGSGWSRVC